MRGWSEKLVRLNLKKMVGGGRLDRRLTLKNGGSLGKRLDPQADGRWEVGPKNRWLGD